MEALITGGAGFIGGAVGYACRDAGITPIVLDDLSAGRSELAAGDMYQGDIADGDLVDRVFQDHPDIAAAVHCAAKIVVPESVARPLDYYRANVAKSIDLVEHLLRNGCHRIVFSSSAAVYAPDADLTVDESSPIDPQNPYAASKMMVERVLADAAAATPLRVVSLRYFNPVGADPLLRTGLPNPAPTHALGKLIEAYETGRPFTITGVDWPTRDGTGIRDYVHVWDLARAHVRSLERFDEVTGGHEVINLGTGTGTTVRELVEAFQSAVGDRLEVREGPRRPGDVAGCYTRTAKARELLGWSAQKTDKDGVLDSLAWSRKRPDVLGA